jgi:hypothetical protein
VKARRLASKIDAPRKGRRPPSLVPRYEVVQVNPDELVATLRRDDGTEFPIYTADGTLPAVGDTVPVQFNGGDPYVTSTRLLVEGTRQSANYLSGVSGWYVGADGNVEFNDGVFRGSVTGNVFQTAADGPRVVISGAQVRSVRYYTDLAGETAPGATASYDDATQVVVEMTSPTFGGRFARFRVGNDLTDGSTFGDLDADNLRVKGISISTPPFSMKRLTGPAQSIPHGLGATIIEFNQNHLVHDASGIIYDTTIDSWKIGRPGIYDLVGTLAWFDDGATNNGSRAIYVVEDGAQREMDSRNFVQGRRTVHNFHDVIIAPGDTTLINPWNVQLRCSQTNFGAAGIDISGRASLGRRSGVDPTWVPPV